MIIGITGNSGAGKSHLIKNLDFEYFLIDADKIGHYCLQMADCKAEIIENFSVNIIENGEINRKKLGEIVFQDKSKLEKLTEITHRYILNEINRLISENSERFSIIIIDAPLLIESGLNKKCDKTILVTADNDEKIKRIVERDNISEKIAFGRIAKQTIDIVQEKNVDIVFENSYNLKAILNFNNIIKELNSNRT